MNQEFQQIESPLASFNNFIITLCERISNIYGYDLVKSNHIIFDNESIILFGYIKITKDTLNKIKLEIKKPIFSDTLLLVRTTLDNYNVLCSIYYNYIFLLNDISKKYDSSVTISYINSIIQDIVSNNIENKLYFIPYRHKIASEIKDNETLANLYNKFSYGLQITKDVKSFKYSIIRLISSDLDESKCIANIRPLEIDTVVKGYFKQDKIEEFLKNLMFYGQIDNIQSITL